MVNVILRFSYNQTQILSSLAKQVTNAQAKRLNELGLSFEALQDLRLSSKDSEDFSKALLDSRVRSKPLHDKLRYCTAKIGGKLDSHRLILTGKSTGVDGLLD